MVCCEKKHFRNYFILVCGVTVLITLSEYSVNKYDPREFQYIGNISKDWHIKMGISTNISDTFPHSLNEGNENTSDISIVVDSSKPFETLSEYLFAFPWHEFEESMQTVNETLYRQRLIDGLQQYAYQEPLMPVNHSCSAPPLINPDDIACERFPDAFLPNKHKYPVKVAHAIQLGFDADSLEIHLNEIFDVVDYFFIIEATRIHCKTLRCLCSARLPYNLFNN